MELSLPARAAVAATAAIAGSTPPSPHPAAGTGTPPGQAPEIVLGMHCVPSSVDPQVTAFWRACAERLRAQGRRLVLISTAELAEPGLDAIEIPFWITGFTIELLGEPFVMKKPPQREVDNIVRWYRCSAQDAEMSLAVSYAYFERLLAGLRPVAVLGWQSANPVTRSLRAMAQAVDIPFFGCERGWVKGTLMFDQGGNNRLSEMQTSFALSQLRDQGPRSEATAPRLVERARRTAELGRYAGPERRSGQALRDALGIPESATVVALFTHGEPFVNALEHSALREFHGLTADSLQRNVQAVAAALQRRGAWLLVQEHPFNAPQGRLLALPDLPCVRTVDESASTVFDAADQLLFTLSTLQFDAALLGRDIGLLARSALFRSGTPPFIGDFETAEAFLAAVGDATTRGARQARLRRDIAFLYETLLFDLEPASLDASADRFVRHVAQLSRTIAEPPFVPVAADVTNVTAATAATATTAAARP